MVLTRSRTTSPASSAAPSRDVAPPQAPAPDLSPRGADTCAAEAVRVDPQPAAGAAAAPIMLSNDQFMLLINRLSRSDPVSTPLPSSHGHFAKCTSRFDGEKTSDVLAFIDAVETYKECVRVDDNNALRGLSMLLTGPAATWWQGVKDTTATWQAAVESLKQTFGPRLPPHNVYRKMFAREQREDEPTDLFVCHVRALIAQLPPSSLKEAVQLDMTYGLLHRRIREKIPRSAFVTFAELLMEARRVEEILDESNSQVSADIKPVVKHTSPTTSTAAPLPRSPISPADTKMPRAVCNYCKRFGHLKEDCQRLVKRKTTTSTIKDTVTKREPVASAVTCFGCGAPGVIRSNCPTCMEKKNVASSVFQSVSASVDMIDSRERPVIDIEIYGEIGKVLIDTGAKHCIGSMSLRSHLVNNGHRFDSVFTELKYADGRMCAQNVEIAHVNVKVRAVTLNVSFIMLPNATESLLGMNFIQDGGMVLDFNRCIWFVRRDRTPMPILFESKAVNSPACSSVGLREDEGSHLVSDERKRLSNLLNIHQDIFAPGGGPTEFAVHRIDNGDAAPITRSPYRVFTAKKKVFARVLQDLKQQVEEQQEARKPTEDQHRWKIPPYRMGDLVLVETHFASNAGKGFAGKFVPRWEGPYRVSQITSPTSYVIADSEGRVNGKYHASALLPYVGSKPVICHQRRRGRPAKSQTGRPCDLEGEDIACLQRSTVRVIAPSPHTPTPRRRAAHIHAAGAPRPRRTQ
ncbi:hypothetical protein PYW07_010606 [Mythimna separata]|uniref:CCHC-type domain-containing protein n=1 Tax=Mythimna separata TaxID=271217 RepID=A0AAD8DMI9_MYTSE|nr:hypothetical protein PYW07_010606 [Mythimna separata]